MTSTVTDDAPGRCVSAAGWGLTLMERRAVTRAIATSYKLADKPGKAKLLDELCATTGWHRDHARKALHGAFRPRAVRQRAPRQPKYGPDVIAALTFCWEVLDMPTGKRLAPMLGELVATLRGFGELDIDDDTAVLLAGMSAATIDRRLAEQRNNDRDRRLAPPGPLVRSPIPLRPRGNRPDAVPGFVDVDLVGRAGAAGGQVWTLTVTDTVTDWTEHRSMPSPDQHWLPAALDDIAAVLPFPILGINSAHRSEFINQHLSVWCDRRRITCTRPQPGNNDGEPSRQAEVRTVAGHGNFETSAELVLLNRIWVLRSQLTNYFSPQQKLIAKVHDGAKATRKYDTATTPHRRTERHRAVCAEDKAILADTYTRLNPAAIQRQITALTRELLALTTTEAAPQTSRAS